MFFEEKKKTLNIILSENENRSSKKWCERINWSWYNLCYSEVVAKIKLPNRTWLNWIPCKFLFVILIRRSVKKNCTLAHLIAVEISSGCYEQEKLKRFLWCLANKRIAKQTTAFSEDVFMKHIGRFCVCADLKKCYFQLERQQSKMSKHDSTSAGAVFDR